MDMDIEDLAIRLSKAEVFDKLPPAECAEVAGLARHRPLKAAEFLCHQGHEWPNVIFLASGRLRWAIVSATGREYVLFELEGGSVFWGHSIFDDLPMPASLTTMEDSEVYQWSRDVILPVLYRNPPAMWKLTGNLVGKMRRAREIIYGLAFNPAAGRIANLLLESFPAQEGVPMERDLTLSEMSARVAASPEVVCRLLHQFQADGVIEVTRASITLLKREALEGFRESDA
jgi:CRP-like cAMP-binding protein